MFVKEIVNVINDEYIRKIREQMLLKYRTTSFSALSSFSATPRLVRPLIQE